MVKKILRLIMAGSFLTIVVNGALAAAPTPQTTTSNAIASLKAYLTEKTTLEGKQIEALTETIKSSKEVIGSNEAILKACFDLITTYDTVKGPLWIGYKDLSAAKRVAGDEIHWAIFWVMQDLMDQVYTSQGMKDHGALLDGFRFGCADLFPGKVEPPEKPDGTYSVQINGSYPKTWGGPLLGQELPARKPTGAYLVPGTIATVTVPESLVNKGYQIRVGAHSWDMAKKPKTLRLYRCTAVYDITSTEVKVANPLGGGIYVEVPYLSNAGIVTISIKNAARSPYFSAKSFHKTTLKEWIEVERQRKAPWADFQSDKFMMQVPTSWIYKLDDPVTLMNNWDMAMDAINDLMGRPHQYGRETMYPQVDLQLRGKAFFPGYPSCNRGYDPTKDYGGSSSNHLVQGPQYAIDYEFHEQGHGCLFAKYPGDREAAVNLLHVAVLNRKFGVELNKAFRESRGQTDEFATVDTTAIAWMMNLNFEDKKGMQSFERQYQLTGHAKFVDIVRLFGWDVLDKFWHSINQDFENGKPWDNNVEDTDRYTLRLSEMAGVDLRPLIHFWGILTQNDAASDAAIKASKLLPSPAIYDLLVKYKGLVPKDNQAFREFAIKWWGKQPSPTGFTSERNHAARWESYDEKEAAKIKQCVQDIIDRYFPAGRPSA
jgi:hypothetical protein